MIVNIIIFSHLISLRSDVVSYYASLKQNVVGMLSRTIGDAGRLSSFFLPYHLTATRLSLTLAWQSS